ncbi:MAG: aconitate hydratase [Armatimonadia bacterium]|nr:aconitate hydratase [Armatimonadia bacterium]
MGDNMVRKILSAHRVDGSMVAGEEIGIKIDQCLTQDATGTMAFLQFEAMELDQVRAELAVSYVDHNMLQTGFENADDHQFLQSTAQKFGAYFSRPGNGICHQVHLERFAIPGKTQLGSDSHTPTTGGIGTLAIGAGGLDVAVAMGGGPFYMRMPQVVRVELTGELQPWVNGKDIILEMLRRVTVKGGVDKIFEYGGPGVAQLTVPQRATVTNMGAELGATTSIFPSDEQTKKYMASQGRGDDWVELQADDGASYDEVIEINLSELEPLIACPHSPDNVVPVTEVAGKVVQQVNIGSCTNSSYVDLATLAHILRDNHAHPNCSVTVSPGSRQVMTMIARDGLMTDIIAAGARVLESACGPCIGMGQAPPTDGVSIRTFNRNFVGRCGSKSGNVYLCSVEVAAACAIAGVIADPRELGDPPQIDMPDEVLIDDGMILPPTEDRDKIEIIRGPNIKPLPLADPVPDEYKGEVLLKVEDNITTDHIMPAGAKILPLRSNIPGISEYVFSVIDPDFATRAQEKDGGIVVGGHNYGQGSSREHAALAPMYLGLKAVIVKSFARIHRANLINFGILPLTADEAVIDAIDQGDELELTDVHGSLLGRRMIQVKNVTKGTQFDTDAGLTGRQTEIMLAGGLLNYTKKQQKQTVA